MRIILKVGDKTLLLQEGVDVKDVANIFEGVLPLREERYSDDHDWAIIKYKTKVEIIVTPNGAIKELVVKEDDKEGKEI